MYKTEADSQTLRMSMTTHLSKSGVTGTVWILNLVPGSATLPLHFRPGFLTKCTRVITSPLDFQSLLWACPVVCLHRYV